MAVSMTATLALGRKRAVAGQPFTLVLGLVEGGGTATNLTSLQPYALRADGRMPAGNVRFGQIANANTIAGNTGAAINIPASATTYFNFDCVIDGPWNGNTRATPESAYYIGVACQTSDGSLFQPGQIIVPLDQHGTAAAIGAVGTRSPAANDTAIAVLLPNSLVNFQYSNTAEPGALAFDRTGNSYLIF